MFRIGLILVGFIPMAKSMQGTPRLRGILTGKPADGESKEAASFKDS
jgi:hypothetical protein